MTSELEQTDYEKIAKYALDISDKSLHEQYVEVQSVRQRASYLVAINALSLTVFFQFMPKGNKLDLVVWGSLALWLVAITFCIVTMLPVGKWRLYQSGGDILRQFTEGEKRLPAHKAFAVMAVLRDRDIVANEPLVRRTHSLIFWGACFTVLQVLSWSVVLTRL